jgi:glutamyl-tRNA reductase
MQRIGVIGVSYRHASVESVARFAIPKAEIPLHLPRLRAALRSDELVYVSTCNRVEIVFAMRDGTADDRRREAFLALIGREPADNEANATLRAWTGEAAIEHLFLVACGLDSAQAGEQEITTQLRTAWQAARAAQVTGPVLDRIMSEALGMARQARRLGRYDAPSIADLAVDSVVGHLADGTDEVALIGVSPMTRRCGLRLRDRGVRLVVVNRSVGAAEELAAELGERGMGAVARAAPPTTDVSASAIAGARASAGASAVRAMSLDEFRTTPPSCAAVMCATGASEPVLDQTALKKLAAARVRPLIVDFGLPPNIDPQTASDVGLKRIGMGDLVRSAQDTRVTHLLRLAPVRSAIDDRLARLRGELAARAFGPQLAEMRDTFERIAASEMDRLLKGELQDLDPARRERLQSWATTLAHRLAHLPLSGMRAAAEHASAEAMDAFFREARTRRGSHSE